MLRASHLSANDPCGVAPVASKGFSKRKNEFPCRSRERKPGFEAVDVSRKVVSPSTLSRRRFSPRQRYFMGAKTTSCTPGSCLNSVRSQHHNDASPHRREEVFMSRCIAAVVLCLISTS